MCEINALELTENLAREFYTFVAHVVSCVFVRLQSLMIPMYYLGLSTAFFAEI